MSLVFRTLRVLLGLRGASRLAPLETSVVHLRVLPNDLDVNFHMNNGRYLSLMDLGRLDLMGRLGVVRDIVRERWRPVLGGATIRFRRSLGPFQRYELHTRIVGWDEKWFYIEQRFVSGGELAAIGVVKGLFLDGDGRVPPQSLVDLVDPRLGSPPIPEAVTTWLAAEERLGSGEPAPTANG